MICKSLIGMHVYLSYHCLILLAGDEVILPDGLKEIVKGTTLLSADDLPAKAVITCMKQLNGRYGCQLCVQEGDPLANAPMVCFWPPEPSVVLRTNEMIIADAKDALKLGEDVGFS